MKKPKKSKQTGEGRGAGAKRARDVRNASAAESEAASAQASAGNPSPKKRWLFRATALLILPLLLLGSLELGLRLAGFGYRTDYFIPETIDGEEVLVPNEKFGLRFFPENQSRSPNPHVLKPDKPEGTRRIFVFGESAALGDPRPGYGFHRFLETLLRRRFPDQRVETVCVAMTAINSHALLPIARECAELDGDLWVVYMGNNEMTGPFGAATVFGRRTPSMAAIRGLLAMRKWRAFQWLESLAPKAGERSGDIDEWQGMRMFIDNALPFQDPRRDVAHSHFKENAEDMLSLAQARGVPVLVAGVTSNLQDCGPFASMNDPALSEADKATFEDGLRSGAEFQEGGEPAAALQAFLRAQAIDETHAELNYRMAQCHEALEEMDLAKNYYSRARDYDALPFRADRYLNEVLQASVESLRSPNVRFVDSFELLESLCPSGVPGAGLFWDHVHFNFKANYALALGLAPLAAEMLELRAEGGPETEEWADWEECRRALALTQWNRDSALSSMMQRLSVPPFVSQLDHREQLDRLGRAREKVLQTVRPDMILPAREIYRSAIQSRPEDFRIRENYAEFLEATGNLEECQDQWRAVHELLPYHFGPWYHLGRLQRRAGEYPAALDSIQNALKVHPASPEIQLEIGRCHFGLGEMEKALAVYDRILNAFPNRAEAYYERAQTRARLEDRDGALADLRKTLELQSGHWRARYLLGVELAADEKLKEAANQFYAVTKIQPDYFLAHLNLGVALVRLGQLSDARDALAEAVRLNPRHEAAGQQLKMLDELISRAKNQAGGDGTGSTPE